MFYVTVTQFHTQDSSTCVLYDSVLGLSLRHPCQVNLPLGKVNFSNVLSRGKLKFEFKR